MLGLAQEGKPLLQAIPYRSLGRNLEFYSIKVESSPTSRLQNIQPGDEIILGKKPTGTRWCWTLKPGKRLMISTGTGIALCQFDA